MKILNVGCGGSTYGTHFLDMYPSRPEVVKCNIDTQKLPFPNNTFDEVYSKNLFEHLKNPNFVLREMFRVAKKGGKIKLITDNGNFIFWHIRGKTHSGGYELHGQHGKEDKHYALYTAHHLVNHLSDVGFKNIKFWYENMNVKNFMHEIAFKTVSVFSKKLGHTVIVVEGIKK